MAQVLQAKAKAKQQNGKKQKQKKHLQLLQELITYITSAPGTQERKIINLVAKYPNDE